MSRYIAFLYGMLCYLVFGVVFLYSIGFVTNLIVPTTIDRGMSAPVIPALAIDLVLLSIFAIQHSVMARQGFKRWWTQFVSKSVERSTYVLTASLALALLLWQWRPIPQLVWQVGDPVWANLLTALSLLGFAMVVFSTFLINHFELFGLSQVTHNLQGHEMPPPRMRTPLLYRVVRHPIYLGFVLAFWAAPVMSAGHLIFAAMTTGYILVGIVLEERDLVGFFGDEYRRYQAKVPMLIPGMKPGPRREEGGPVGKPL